MSVRYHRRAKAEDLTSESRSSKWREREREREYNVRKKGGEGKALAERPTE